MATAYEKRDKKRAVHHEKVARMARYFRTRTIFCSFCVSVSCETAVFIVNTAIKAFAQCIIQASGRRNRTKKGCESRKTLGYDFILRLTYKRGCDHGEGDPRGEVWRSARDAGEWAKTAFRYHRRERERKKYRKTDEKGRFEAVKRAELRFRGKPTVPPRSSPR